MNSPIKYLYITMSDANHGVVTGVVTIYISGATAGEPLPGQLRREFAVTADYDALWLFSIDDEGYEHWLPPLANGVATTMGTGAGGGEQRPPQ